ncbi:MAG: indole-3-glycerol-phosphate synthase [Thaumarchaeota archaeon]|nr:indole-3-glycerol-phosphate synthase [Nitrososphaerota archaeon]
MSFLEKACQQARKRILKGYYDIEADASSNKIISLVKALDHDEVSLICELKSRSPSHGEIRRIGNPVKLAKLIELAGANGLSILTDPDNFSGSIKHLAEISRKIGIPTLMKDFIISTVQIEAARKAGASAILLIYPAYARGYSDTTLDHAIDYAHDLGLEVLLEAYTPKDLKAALSTDADLIGVNSRNLDTLDVSLERAYRIIELAGAGEPERIVVESGIKSAHDILLFKRLGVKRFLVGTSIMSSPDIRSKIRELKEAGRIG